MARDGEGSAVGAVTDRLLEACEVAERLSVPVSWVRAETRAGRMPHVQLGRYRRYRESDLRAWLESLTEGGTPGWRKHRPALVE
jgi:excisionase family DNA binding protein